MDTKEKEGFCTEFLQFYMAPGLGSMPKSDIDALVLILIDKYGCFAPEIKAQANLSNQKMSEAVRAPLATVKRLRYQGALKFARKDEGELLERLCSALGVAAYEIGSTSDHDRVKIIIEDLYLKNWMQDRLKENGDFFDGSFNAEAIRVKIEAFEKLLMPLLAKGNKEESKEIEKLLKDIKSEGGGRQRKALFQRVLEFSVRIAEGLAAYGSA
jgi:hypothetical protein